MDLKYIVSCERCGVLLDKRKCYRRPFRVGETNERKVEEDTEVYACPVHDSIDRELDRTRKRTVHHVK